MCLTSYSSVPCSNSHGGSSCFWYWKGSWVACFNQHIGWTWCITNWWGDLIWFTQWLMTSVILWCSMWFQLSFLLGWIVNISHTSDHSRLQVSELIPILRKMLAFSDCMAWAFYIYTLSLPKYCSICWAICWVFTLRKSFGFFIGCCSKLVGGWKW
jgi:hypothetical protein